MTKKILSLAIALVMLMALAIVPASAVSETEQLTEAEASAAVTAAASALVDADEDAEVEVSEDLADKITEDADTPEEISRAIAQLVFVEKSQVEAISDRIIADSRYSVKVLDDGKTTVYIGIDLDTNPEIYDARVFLNVVQKLRAKCDEKALAKGVDIDSDNYTPMSYEQMAGELALHMITADVTDMLGANDWSANLKEIYDHAIHAGLEIDEDRISPDFVKFLGGVITFFLEMLFG
ncbi:MAG: hypothetical protein IJ491_03560 [Clostridia bacterium]|nr:hypothetical protein [Clostridia bacterium]